MCGVRNRHQENKTKRTCGHEWYEWRGWYRSLWRGSGRRQWLSNVACGWKHGGSDGVQTLPEVGSQRHRGVVTEGRHVFVRLSLRLTQPDGVTTISDESAQ